MRGPILGLRGTTSMTSTVTTIAFKHRVQVPGGIKLGSLTPCPAPLPSWWPRHLLQIQHAGLHPGHVDAPVHLVDAAFHQPHRQRLHHQQLHLRRGRCQAGASAAKCREGRRFSVV